MRVLIVGQGGREHAIVKALARSAHKPELLAFMSSVNPGILPLCREYTLGKLRDVPAITAWALEKKCDLVVIGPEEPLMHGLADELVARGIPCVGPQKKLAELEGSKLALRALVAKYLPEANPDYRECVSPEQVSRAIQELGKVAVKPLGLTSGKGVKVMGTQLPTVEDAVAYASQIIAQDGRVLLEELMEGEEFSQMVFTDGVQVKAMPLAQDAKFAYEGDTGPMTGGMGSYTMPDQMLPFMTAEARAQAIGYVEKLLASAQEAYGLRYHGILYGQFMLTRRGPKFVEVNVRLGDPEAINVMALLKTDPLEVFQGMACGLPERVAFFPQASVCKYLVPQGYPEHSRTDIQVKFDEDVLRQTGTEVIYAGAEAQGEYCRPTGSRFAAILAMRDQLPAAESAVEEAIGRLGLDLLYHRRDIATPETIDKKIHHMQLILSA